MTKYYTWDDELEHRQIKRKVKTWKIEDLLNSIKLELDNSLIQKYTDLFFFMYNWEAPKEKPYFLYPLLYGLDSLKHLRISFKLASSQTDLDKYQNIKESLHIGTLIPESIDNIAKFSNIEHFYKLLTSYPKNTIVRFFLINEIGSYYAISLREYKKGDFYFK